MTYRDAQTMYTPDEVNEIILVNKIDDNIFTAISHTANLLKHLTDFHKIIEPDYYEKSANFYKEKRDATYKNLGVNAFYHNRLVDLFISAEQLCNYMTPIDEAYFGIYTINIKKVLDLKKEQYNIGTFTLNDN